MIRYQGTGNQQYVNDKWSVFSSSVVPIATSLYLTTSILIDILRQSSNGASPSIQGGGSKKMYYILKKRDLTTMFESVQQVQFSLFRIV